MKVLDKIEFNVLALLLTAGILHFVFNIGWSFLNTVLKLIKIFLIISLILLIIKWLWRIILIIPFVILWICLFPTMRNLYNNIKTELYKVKWKAMDKKNSNYKLDDTDFTEKVDVIE